jgi:hypothetical protein
MSLLKYQNLYESEWERIKNKRREVRMIRKLEVTANNFPVLGGRCEENKPNP